MSKKWNEFSSTDRSISNPRTSRRRRRLIDLCVDSFLLKKENTGSHCITDITRFFQSSHVGGQRLVCLCPAIDCSRFFFFLFRTIAWLPVASAADAQLLYKRRAKIVWGRDSWWGGRFLHWMTGTVRASGHLHVCDDQPSGSALTSYWPAFVE